MNMAKRAATSRYDPSGIDLDAWTELEEQLEATIPNYDRVNRLMTRFTQDCKIVAFILMKATLNQSIFRIGSLLFLNVMHLKWRMEFRLRCIPTYFTAIYPHFVVVFR